MLQLGRKAKVACKGLIFAAAFFTSLSSSYALSLDGVRVVASQIESPEGPAYLPDGTLAAVSFMPGKIIQTVPDAPEQNVDLATVGRGVSGAALTKDGKLLVARMNMGKFLSQFGDFPSENSDAGQILLVDIASKTATVLFDETKGDPIVGPNDLVMDATGNAWFSDAVEGNILFLDADRKSVSVAASNIPGVNGIALSPDGSELYVTNHEALLAYNVLTSRKLGDHRDVAVLPKDAHTDGIKVQENGKILVSVGTMGIWRVSPDGSDSELIDFDGENVVNFTFGLGDDASTLFTIINGDAGLTGKAGGKILAVKWDSRGVSFGD